MAVFECCDRLNNEVKWWEMIAEQPDNVKFSYDSIL